MTIKIEKMMGNQKTLYGEENKKVQTKLNQVR